MKIAPSAVVHPAARLADDVEVGPYSIIEEDVEIGSGTVIHSHAVIYSGTRLGRNCLVGQSAAVGAVPQDLKYAGEKSYLEIGDHTVIREFASLHRGTAESVTTRIGAHCLIMAYVHVAHDCQVGDHVILANAVNLAGHVHLGSWVTIGGMVPVHQFVHVGQHSFVGGGVRVTKDVPPFILAAGDPLRYAGLNVVGLKRRGFDAEELAALKQAYKTIYGSRYNVSQALENLEANSQHPRVREVVEFIRGASRGII